MKNLSVEWLFFFGGGWTSGSVRQFEPQARELTRLGMAVALPDYRVLSKYHTPIETDWQNRDFTLKDNSPVLELGYISWNISQTGIQNQE